MSGRLTARATASLPAQTCLQHQWNRMLHSAAMHSVAIMTKSPASGPRSSHRNVGGFNPWSEAPFFLRAAAAAALALGRELLEESEGEEAEPCRLMRCLKHLRQLMNQPYCSICLCRQRRKDRIVGLEDTARFGKKRLTRH